MKWMLDTNICIDIIKERPRSVLDRFKAHTVGDIGVSVVTLAELEYGVSASSRPAKNREALDQFVSPTRSRAVRPRRDCSIRSTARGA